MSEDALHEDTLLVFPCTFPIKAMVHNTQRAVDEVIRTVAGHCGGRLPKGAVTTRTSRNGNYRSVTLVIEAASRDQLDDIYRDITALESVVMAF